MENVRGNMEVWVVCGWINVYEGIWEDSIRVFSNEREADKYGEDIVGDGKFISFYRKCKRVLNGE